jgi:hypothetical protein
MNNKGKENIVGHSTGGQQSSWALMLQTQYVLECLYVYM